MFSINTFGWLPRLSEVEKVENSFSSGQISETFGQFSGQKMFQVKIHFTFENLITPQRPIESNFFKCNKRAK